ncbi:uncharacterized protein CLAFUR5_10743 [Fulvia fulva]|uniref:Uncharacterized protein n=1 Tax=Passalora fulva TaxID=5499 RepID=A0A9Q8URY3_PASFU|nr:uncharacterized protein CLAFUR5_10743 [Fulvia fulva]KAK4620726.1 hypothetical protein CLAFUR0_11715 [Fulvia fulva]UJO20213.1 hypothetical protein CLAFUR5_10743 [Fulvia fulva]WPV32061.1 hypothetical protein CLAFUW7_11705 [Fulvia fulva]
MDLIVVCLLPAISAVLYILWHIIRSRDIQQVRGNVDEKSRPPEQDPYHDIEPLQDFDWSTTSPIRNSPLKPKYHLTMALENISLSDILAMDNTYAERIKTRRTVMDEHPDATLRCNYVCEPAVLELYDWMINTFLPKRFPGIYHRTAKGTLNTVNSETIPSQPKSPMAALRTLGDHIDTDFLLLLPSSTAADGSPIYHLEAFVTCFPSGFSTQKKLGLPLSETHTPVPGYKAKLEKSMDRFFAKIECGRAVKRSNWALTTHPLLFTEGGNHLYANGKTDMYAEEKDVDDTKSDDKNLKDDILRQRKEVVIKHCRLRSERQTLFRLPKTKALVFSFKTYQYTLADVKKDGYAEQLAEAMEGLSQGNVPEMDFYKRGVVWREPVAEYLRS